MSELIDRQAVLDALSNAVPSLTTPDGCGQFDRELQIVGEALVDAMQIVHALPAASAWHRVEDGLPDKYTQCLVADADGKCAVGYYRYDCKAWDSPAFGWIEAEDRMYIDDIPMGIGKVVAWMPIEPPKEDA